MPDKVIAKLPDKKLNPKAAHASLTGIVGKTIIGVVSTTVKGAYGDEPCVMLYFNDNTKHGFVLPSETE